MELTPSQAEISRRRKAFLALIFSSLLGILLFSSVFDFYISLLAYVLLVLMSLVSIILTMSFLHTISNMKIRLTEKVLERVKGHKVDRFPLSEVKRIKIKKRANGKIREVSLLFRNHKPIFIDAYEGSFERLLDFIHNANQDVEVVESREPIDFDSVFFYPSLGLILSGITVLFFKYLTSIDYTSGKILIVLLSVYVFLVSIYFFSRRPIGARIGKQSPADVVFGIVLVIASLLMFGLVFYY